MKRVHADSFIVFFFWGSFGYSNFFFPELIEALHTVGETLRQKVTLFRDFGIDGFIFMSCSVIVQQ